MRYISLVVLMICLSCHSKDEVPQDLIGKWKIYKTQLNQKDITKSADPTNENGLEFDINGNYISFGNSGHQDKGTFTCNEESLILKSNTSGLTKAKIALSKDSLQLKMPLGETQVLFIKLYKME